MLALWEITKVDHVILEPALPWLQGGHLGLDLLVLNDLPGNGVDQKHLAWLQTTLAHDSIRRDVRDPNLRGEDYKAILGH